MRGSTLPGVVIMLIITVVLVRGIRESATMNAVLVLIKLGGCATGDRGGLVLRQFRELDRSAGQRAFAP